MARPDAMKNVSQRQIDALLDEFLKVPGSENDQAALRRAVENARAHWGDSEDAGLVTKGLGVEKVTERGVETEQGSIIQPSIHARLSPSTPTPRQTGLEEQGKVEPESANQEIAETNAAPTQGRHATKAEPSGTDEEEEEKKPVRRTSSKKDS
jgi:hypothetical protein